MRAKIFKFIQTIFLLIELIALVLIFLRYFVEEESQLLTSTGYILLAALYFLSAYFEKPEGLPGFAMFGKRIMGITLAICVLGLYSTFLPLPGAQTILTVGIVGVVFSLIILLIEILRKPTTANFVKYSVIRGLIISIFSAIILYYSFNESP